MRSYLLLPLLLILIQSCSLTATKGTLSISSQPGNAQIYINGKLKGNTPGRKGKAISVDLPKGQNKVEIVKPRSKHNEYYASRSVLITDGTENSLSLPLKLRITSAFRKQLMATTGNEIIEPDMIRVPAGTFSMGCVSDIDCLKDQKPVHNVTIKEFMLAKHELTFKEWDVCVAQGGCSHYPDDYKFGRDNRPVLNVSWDDAQQYIHWLNEKTDKQYRLANEAEWEYAARAGTTTPFNTGRCLSTDMANYDGDSPLKGCEKGKDRKQTLEVGSLPTNQWGLHDMHGNVWEWTQDCWASDYKDAPDDGSAFEFENCPRRVLRGGGWNYRGSYNRSAIRYDYSHSLRLENLGFRLAM